MGHYRQPMALFMVATPKCTQLEGMESLLQSVSGNEATLINQTRTRLSCPHYYKHAYSALNVPLESDWMEKLTEGGTDTGGALAGYPVPAAGGPPAAGGG